MDLKPFDCQSRDLIGIWQSLTPEPFTNLATCDSNAVAPNTMHAHLKPLGVIHVTLSAQNVSAFKVGDDESHTFVQKYSATFASDAHESFLLACQEAEASKDKVWLGLVDVERQGLLPDDNHANGLHVNAVWMDATKFCVHRYDPYYAHIVQDTTQMQKALDDAFLMCIQSLPLIQCHQWTFAVSDAKHQAPFGPQFIDASPSGVRQRFSKTCEHEFCAVWCELALICLMDKGAERSSEFTSLAVLKKLDLPVPQTVAEAKACVTQYFQAVLRATNGSLHDSLHDSLHCPLHGPPMLPDAVQTNSREIPVCQTLATSNVKSRKIPKHAEVCDSSTTDPTVAAGTKRKRTAV